MSTQHPTLPQLGGDLFLTDGGIETTLGFLEGFELPHFAAFVLLEHDAGRQALARYYRRHASIARDRGVGFILESATWRASADWGTLLGYSAEALDELNRQAITLLQEVRDELATARSPMVISGCVGPRGDGYQPGRLMSVEQARAFHARQVDVFATSGADLVSAMTMTNVPEAVGFVEAAQIAGIPAVVAFTVETDGRLPAGETLAEAITAVDSATGEAPVYYMVNCAHPTHFAGALEAGGAWLARLRGVRANASSRSHAELDGATDLDAGDPVELGRQYADLRRRLPHLNVLGGCCGTDHRHIEQICLACAR
jgi:S-methylmethionine-dependent homocysteine/selenocysteine methylase